MKRLFSLLLMAVLSIGWAHAGPETRDKIPDLTKAAKRIKADPKAAWQTLLADEIDDMQVVPGQGVLVGQTRISWDSEVYVPSYGPYILFDAETGAKKWEHSRSGSFDNVHAILCTSPVILIAETEASGTSYKALRPETGKEVWSCKAGKTQTFALDPEKSLFLVFERNSKDGKLTAFDLETGKKKWTDEADSGSSLLPELLLAGDEAFVAGNVLACHDLADGKRKWTNADLGQMEITSYVLPLSGNELIYPNSQGKLFRIAADGRVLWRQDTGSAVRAMVEEDGLLFVQHGAAGKPDSLSCYAVKDGAKLWENSLIGTLSSSLLPAEGKLAYTVINQEAGKVFLEFRNPGSGEVVSSSPLPPETLLRLSDRLIHRPGQIIIAGERWVGAFRIQDGRRLWFYLIPGTEMTYYDLVDKLGEMVFTAQKSADNVNRNLAKGFEAVASNLRVYNQKCENRILKNPNTSIGTMEAIYSSQRSQAATDLVSSGISAMLALAESRRAARDHSYVQYWNCGLRTLLKLQQHSIQGDFYVRSCDPGDNSQGVMVVDLKSGAWHIIRTSPSCQYYFCDYMNFRLPSLAVDGSRLFLRGIGLDPSKWKAVKDKLWRVDPYDTINIVPTPSVLAYDTRGLEFQEFSKYTLNAGLTDPVRASEKADLSNLDPASLKSIQVNKRWGLADKAGRIVLEPRYDDRVVFLQDGYAVVQVDKKFGIIDASMRVVVKPVYANIFTDLSTRPWTLFHEGLCAVHTGSTYAGSFGFVDTKGNVAIPLQFEWAKNFSEGLAACCERKKGWGYIDTSGKFVIPPNPDYSNAEDFHEGLAAVDKKGGDHGYIDRNGKVVIPFRFKFAYPFENGIARVAVGSKHGLIDKTGKFVIEPKYEQMGEFKNGYAVIKMGEKKFGLIDKSGKEFLPAIYEYCDDEFCDGLLIVAQKGKYGAIDATGKVMVELKYEYCTPFLEGLSLVTMNKKRGLIDITGREAVPIVYDNCGTRFENGYLRVSLNDEEFYLDKEGKRHEIAEVKAEIKP